MTLEDVAGGRKPEPKYSAWVSTISLGTDVDSGIVITETHEGDRGYREERPAVAVSFPQGHEWGDFERDELGFTGFDGKQADELLTDMGWRRLDEWRFSEKTMTAPVVQVSGDPGSLGRPRPIVEGDRY